MDLSRFDALCAQLETREFVRKKEFCALLGDFDLNFQIAQSLGIALKLRNSRIFSKHKCAINRAEFCVVDIETTNSNTQIGEVIEIGALKFKGGKIIDEFRTFVRAERGIPPKIVELTGIKNKMIRRAPELKRALHDFKLFLQDGIFLAHNVNFDFNFLNAKLESCALPPMKNARICTFELARRTIIAPKHGLGFLNEFLEINAKTHHRALSDCEIAFRVFLISLEKLGHLQNTQALINLARTIQTPNKNKKNLESHANYELRKSFLLTFFF